MELAEFKDDNRRDYTKALKEISDFVLTQAQVSEAVALKLDSLEDLLEDTETHKDEMSEDDMIDRNCDTSDFTKELLEEAVNDEEDWLL